MSSKKDNIITTDNYYMGLALALAKENHGLTKENPSVGCVLVKNNQIISTGVTSINGRPHAEYNACLLYTSPSPRDKRQSRMPSSA